MKKLSALIVLIIVVFASNLQAQTKIELMHEAGISNLFLRYEFGVNTAGLSATVTDAQYFPGISYAPRLNFYDEGGDGNNSFSINLNNDFLFGNMISPTFEKKSWAFSTNLSFNLNLGAGATKNTLSQFGGYLGLGYGYSNINLVNTNQLNRILNNITADPNFTPDLSKAVIPLQGIYFHLGGRMKVGSGVISLEGYSILTPELSGVYTVGIRALYGFGIGF